MLSHDRRLPALGRLELGLGLLLTLLVIGVHVVYVSHAGALWRDEVQIVNISTMPTWAGLWEMSEHDTFPILWPALVRAWTAVGAGATDTGLFVLGCLVGLGIVGLLWWNARQAGAEAPLVSLAVFATCPTLVVYGDSLRGYGLGTLALVAMIVAVRRYVMAPGRPRAIVAGVAAVLAVNAMYFSAVLLLAVGVAGMIVHARRRAWRPVLVLAGIGLAAAASLLPYIDPLSRQYRWNSFVKYEVDLPWFWEQFTKAATASGDFMLWVWMGLAVLIAAGCIKGVACSRGRLREHVSASTREHAQANSGLGMPPGTGGLHEDAATLDLALFTGLSGVLGVAAYVGFLVTSRLPTQPWYYIGIMAFLAVTADAAAHVLVGGRAVLPSPPAGEGSGVRGQAAAQASPSPGRPNSRAATLSHQGRGTDLAHPRAYTYARLLRLVLAVGVTAAVASPLWQAVHTRRTSIDLIAAELEKSAAPEDLIVVHPWWPAISFNRYYRGRTPWTTLPELAEIRVQRFDLVRDKVMEPEPIRPVLRRMADTLASGRRVWLIGDLILLEPGEGPGHVPPLPIGEVKEAPYMTLWSRQLGFFMQRYARRLDVVRVAPDEAISRFENPNLLRFEGWRAEPRP